MSPITRARLAKPAHERLKPGGAAHRLYALMADGELWTQERAVSALPDVGYRTVNAAFVRLRGVKLIRVVGANFVGPAVKAQYVRIDRLGSAA